MRFLVLFREDAGVSSELLERIHHHLVDLQGQGKVFGETLLGAGAGVAAIVEVASDEELRRLLDAPPIREHPTAEAVPLSGESDFPLTFGKQKGQLAAWEKVMASREDDAAYRPYASSSTNRKLRS